MTVSELLDSIVAVGGTLKVNGDKLSYWLPDESAHLIEELRRLKPEIMPLLESIGGRLVVFPACPQCRKWALYREENGLYECQSCGFAGFDEAAARKAGIDANTPRWVM